MEHFRKILFATSETSLSINLGKDRHRRMMNIHEIKVLESLDMGSISIQKHDMEIW